MEGSGCGSRCIALSGIEVQKVSAFQGKLKKKTKLIRIHCNTILNPQSSVLKYLEDGVVEYCC